MELEIRHEFKKIFSNLLNNNRSYHGRFITFANSWIPVLFNVFQSSEEHKHCLFFIAKKYASPVFDQRKAGIAKRIKKKSINLLEGNVERDLHSILSAACLLSNNSYVFCLLPHSDNLLKHLTATGRMSPNIIFMVDLDCLLYKDEEQFYNKIITKYGKLKSQGWNFMQLNNYNLHTLITAISNIKANYASQPSVIALKTNWMQMLIDL